MSEQTVERSELWATFSVKDHVRPGAFVAEVLLYDRLLLPVPPHASDLPLDPDGTKTAEAEWRRWKENGWDPARQGQLLGIMGDLAEPIPWTADRQAEWRQEMANQLDFAARNGFFLTGAVLEKFAPAMALSVVAVSPYRSLKQLSSEQGIRRRIPHEPIPRSVLMAVIGQELLVPPEPDRDDFQALADAVEVAHETDYRTRRAALWRWQQRFVRGDHTDALSVRAAVQEMRQLVADLRRATGREKRWKLAKKVFFFLKLGSSVAPGAVAVGAKAAEVVASIGDFVADSHEVAASGDPVGAAAASLIVDATDRLDLTS